MTSPKSLRLPEDLARIIDIQKAHRPSDLTVACYVWPSYHGSAIYDRLCAPGWTEYELMRACRPWFAGHEQPRSPILGELDERRPQTWELYNRLAKGHGIDAWIFDWYWFNGEPSLHEALEEGFLQSTNRETMKFAVMWTSHGFPLWYPTRKTDGAIHRRFCYPAPGENLEQTYRSLYYAAARYFHLPNYWRIDGKPVLVLYGAWSLLGLGKTPAGAREILDRVRDAAKTMGHPEIHVHVSAPPYLNAAELEAMGVDSYAHYNPIGDVVAKRPPEETFTDYGDLTAEIVQKYWPQWDAMSPLPQWAAVGVGFDNAPRHIMPVPYKRTPENVDGAMIVLNDTPAKFKAFVQAALAYLNERPNIPPVLTIGTWNEWTEGHYLLPDARHGFGMLEALAEALEIPIAYDPAKPNDVLPMNG